MANSYTSLLYHVVFSTKFRHPNLTAPIRNQLWPYLGGIARNAGLLALEVGGYFNHAHVLIAIPPRIALAKAVQLLKGGSTPWIKSKFPGATGFAWQDGYGAFSVSSSRAPIVRRYIRDQEEHHRIKTFEEEYRDLLRRHGVAFDERYLFD